MDKMCCMTRVKIIIRAHTSQGMYRGSGSKHLIPVAQGSSLAAAVQHSHMLLVCSYYSGEQSQAQSCKQIDFLKLSEHGCCSASCCIISGHLLFMTIYHAMPKLCVLWQARTHLAQITVK